MTEARIQQSYSIPQTSPLATGVNNLGSGAGQVVIAANPTRRAITFHAAGTVDVIVYPTAIAVAPTFAAPGGGYLIFAGAEKTILADGALLAVNCGWSAIARAGANNALTILEYV